MNFLISQKITNVKNNLSLFPTFSLQYDCNVYSKYSRLGWCYGDLGIGLFVWDYSNSLNFSTFNKEAIDIFTHASIRRELEINDVFDASICHGTAGIAAIFNRIWIKSKEITEFKYVSDYWINQTLLMMDKNENGCAGYKTDRGDISLNLLDGLSGIGLVLLSQITKDNDWDECLLLS